MRGESSLISPRISATAGCPTLCNSAFPISALNYYAVPTKPSYNNKLAICQDRKNEVIIVEDYLIRVLAKEAGVRGIACVTTDLTNEVVERQNATLAIAGLLAETLTGAALMGSLLKIQHRVALKFEGNGPAERALVESDAYGKIRGFVQNPEVNAPIEEDKFNTAVTLGTAGLLTVVKDLKLKELAESVVPIGGSPIDTELTLFLTQSEQIPSLVSIGFKRDEEGKIAVSGGLLLQALPPYDPEIMLQLANRLEELPPFADMLQSGKTPEQILADVFAGIEYIELEKRPLLFHCDCSRERTERALMSMGKAELEDLINTQGEAEVNCQYCQESYYFSKEDLEDLLVELV